MRVSWSGREPGSLSGEPVFISSPNAQEEDDGILMSVVIDEGKRRSFLLVLDARDLQEIARSEVLPFIPYGLARYVFSFNRGSYDKN